MGIATILGVNAALLLAYMTLWYLVAFKKRRLDVVDTVWGLGFVVVAWSSLLQHPVQRSLLIAVLVSLWGIRLAVHIWRRSQRRGSEDPRYSELSAKWQGNFWLRAYFSVFLLQGLLVWIISLPIDLEANRQINGLNWLSITGTLVWLIGFSFEAIADRQLTTFLRQQDHPKVMQTGLWRYSRHPNYFGELVQWWGIGIIALQVSNGWIGLIGPLTLSGLIIFVSGIPPIERRRQKDRAYRDYQQRTSVLIPWPSRLPS